jgi:hypothetical protein
VRQGYSSPPGFATATGEVTRFWRHVFGGERGLLHLWTGIRDSAAGGGKIPNTTIKRCNFRYPAAAKDAAQWALEKAGEGREVYYCAHLLTGPQRRKEYAASVLTLWAEYDGKPVPNGELKPTCVVESSPGRFHAYMRLTDPIPPGTAENLNKRISQETGADPSGFDLTQLLRVPLTTNHKYAGRPTVRVVELEDGRTFTPAELDELLPSASSERVVCDEL